MGAVPDFVVIGAKKCGTTFLYPATRQRLEDHFEPHNRRLYEYLGVDFGW